VRTTLLLGSLALVGLVAAAPARAQTCVFQDQICEGDILVTDVLSDALIRLTRGQQVLATISGSPRGLDIDPTGFPLVSESVANEILRVNLENGTLELISSPLIDSSVPWVVPEELLLEPQGTLLVVEPFKSGAYRLDPVTGNRGAAYLSQAIFPDPAAKPSFPEGIALDPDDPARIYFADADNLTPTLWHADLTTGEIQAVAQLGALGNPHDVVVFRTGPDSWRLLVSDPGAQAIFAFDPPASFDPAAPPLVPDDSYKLIQAPTVDFPLGLAALDSDDDEVDDRLLVVDFGQSAVRRFTSDGSSATLETSFTGGSLDGPWSVAFVDRIDENARSDFVVIDTGSRTLHRVEIDPAEPAQGTRSNLSQDMSFGTPTGVAVLDPASGGEARYGVSDSGSASSCGVPALIEVTDDGLLPGAGSQVDVCGDGTLIAPNRLAALDTNGDGAEDQFLVADPDQRTVFRVLTDGTQTPLVVFDPPVAPVALTLDRDGVLYVLNRYEDFQVSPPDYDALVRVSPQSGCRQASLFSAVLEPIDLSVDPVSGEVLVADQRSLQFELGVEHPGVLRIDPRTGVIGGKLYGPFPARRIGGIAVDGNRELLVTTGEPGPCDPEIDPNCDPTPPPPAVLRVNTTANAFQTIAVGPETTLTALAMANATDLAVADTTGFAAGDPVRVELDNGSRHSTTIDSVPAPGAPGTLQLLDGLPSAASAGRLLVEVVWQDPRGIAIEPVGVPVLNDADGDAVGDSVDNCRDDLPGAAPCVCSLFFPDPACPGSSCPHPCFNPLQRDVNLDGFGDVCQPDDDDHDGVPAEGGDGPCPSFLAVGCDDNCPNDANTNQSDLNQDGLGDVCQTDDPDHDGIPSDGDGSGTPGDALCASGVTLDCDDNCPDVANPDQLNDFGADPGPGDACEDQDMDGFSDAVDNCPELANELQEDFDEDGFGDVCDSDDDADGVVDSSDNCVFADNAGQEDADGDGCGDACDPFADFNGDTVVGTPDFFLWRNEFKASCTGPSCQGDANDDDVVGTPDFFIWRDEFQQKMRHGPSGLSAPPRDPASCPGLP